MVNSTALQLNSIWDEVGFSAAEREVQITVLLQEVQRLFEEKVRFAATAPLVKFNLV
jgi:hypothetical protein